MCSLCWPDTKEDKGSVAIIHARICSKIRSKLKCIVFWRINIFNLVFSRYTSQYWKSDLEDTKINKAPFWIWIIITFATSIPRTVNNLNSEKYFLCPLQCLIASIPISTGSVEDTKINQVPFWIRNIFTLVPIPSVSVLITERLHYTFSFTPMDNSEPHVNYITVLAEVPGFT